MRRKIADDSTQILLKAIAFRYVKPRRGDMLLANRTNLNQSPSGATHDPVRKREVYACVHLALRLCVKPWVLFPPIIPGSRQWAESGRASCSERLKDAVP